MKFISIIASDLETPILVGISNIVKIERHERSKTRITLSRGEPITTDIDFYKIYSWLEQFQLISHDNEAPYNRSE